MNIVLLDPATACYLKGYPKPAGWSESSKNFDAALNLDSPRVRGIISN
jgi:hypothetical protein